MSLEPDHTLAILVGASSWPRLPGFESAVAFSHTAEKTREYILSPQGLGLTSSHLLDLFDSDVSSNSQYHQITTFLYQRLERLNSKAGKKLTVFFWYIGHGALFGPDQDYCLLIRGTDPDYKRESSLQVSGIAELFRKLVPGSARIVVLDCCHAGQAAKIFQGEGGVETVLADKTERAFEGGSSVAILAASSAKSPAQLAAANTWTLFGRAVLDALTQGNPNYEPKMTLRDVRELALNALVSGAVQDFPKPEVHSPNQKEFDLAGVPLFPNPAVAEYSAGADPALVASADSKGIVSSQRSVEPFELSAREADEKLQRLVLTGTPISALAAARRLAEERGKTGLISSELTSGSGIPLWRLYIAREALKADPQAAACAILPLARNASTEWHTARSAVDLLSPALQDEVSSEMAEMLNESEDFDDQRIAIEALGRVGASRQGSFVVAAAGSPDNRDRWDKLGSFVPVALARMARFENRTANFVTMSQPGAVGTLARFVEQYGAEKSLTTAFRQSTAEVARMGPEHADHVIAYWLNADNRDLVSLGATALGHMRLVRGRQPLIERLEQWGDFADPLAGRMSEEIARIGGSEAYEWLAEHLDGRYLYRSLALCLDDLPETEFEKIAKRLIRSGSERLSWRAYMAIGKRPLLSLVPELDVALSSAEPVVRGVGAIALARASGTSVVGQLRRAVAEAGRSDERLLITLALLIATQDTGLVEQLEEPLAEQCWRWDKSLIEDVVCVLNSWGGPHGADLAQALRWIAVASDPS